MLFAFLPYALCFMRKHQHETMLFKVRRPANAQEEDDS